MDWPDRIDEPIDDHLRRVGRIVRAFGDRRDSRSPVVGVEVDGERFVVKHAGDPESIGWLESAVRFHAAVRHRAIPTVVARIETPDGVALVEEWAPGEVLRDPFDPAVPDIDEPGSPYQRFLGLPTDTIVAALDELIDAHVAVTSAGFVAVDLYDGCVVHDLDRHRLSLVDLDLYRPGPFVLEADRQFGSSTFMAPEEWERGATIDERTTVFTLGRFVLVLLGCQRKSAPRRSDFRGSDEQFDIATIASEPRPDDRFQTVTDLASAWSTTR